MSEPTNAELNHEAYSRFWRWMSNEMGAARRAQSIAESGKVESVAAFWMGASQALEAAQRWLMAEAHDE